MKISKILKITLISGLCFLASCANKPDKQSPAGIAPIPPQTPNALVTPTAPTVLPDITINPALGKPIIRAKSRWIPVSWNELPEFDQDELFQAWGAWIKSCEKPNPAFTTICKEIRKQLLSDDSQKRQWLKQNMQPYRVLAHEAGNANTGLLTSYFEPHYEASRYPTATHQTPLYSPPASLKAGRAWYSRQEIAQNPAVKAQLAGSAIAYLANPVDAMILHIQGSGRLSIKEANGQTRLSRLAYASTNNLPYKSPAKWLIDQGYLRNGTTWPSINETLAANPHLIQPFMYSNPRVVFFKEEQLDEMQAQIGPKGAQGVPLTPGRSIAVDPQSIPYGTPVWLSTAGVANLNRLVIAQDTGSAIRGAVRADYFAGWGVEAGNFAGQVKQPLKMWALWPK